MTTTQGPIDPDPWAPEVRDGFLRLVAGHKIRAVRRGVSIETVTREELVRPTPLHPHPDSELGVLSWMASLESDALAAHQRAGWTARRARLHAQILGTRSMLAQQAGVVADPVLVQVLADRAAAIEAFDPEIELVPRPDENDYATVEAVLAERITTVRQSLAAQQISVDPQTLLRSLTDAYRPTTSPTGPIGNGRPWSARITRFGAVTDPDHDPEIELVDRLLARSPASQTTATTLLVRMHQQRQALSQTLTDVVVVATEFRLRPDEVPTAVLTYDSIMKCDVDIRRELYENVILSSSVPADRLTLRFRTLVSAPPTLMIGAPADRDPIGR